MELFKLLITFRMVTRGTTIEKPFTPLLQINFLEHNYLKVNTYFLLWGIYSFVYEVKPFLKQLTLRKCIIVANKLV